MIFFNASGGLCSQPIVTCGGNAGCKKPLFIAFESKYLSDWNEEYFNYKYYDIIDKGFFGYFGGYLNSADKHWKFSDECIFAISHANSVNADEGLLYYSPYAIPLAIHVKNLCTQEEFHLQGNFATTNIRLIPECKTLLNGWDQKDDSVAEKCLKAIPSTWTAEFTPATDFDWSQVPQWELYRDYYNCEDFQ